MIDKTQMELVAMAVQMAIPLRISSYHHPQDANVYYDYETVEETANRALMLAKAILELVVEPTDD